MKINESYAIKEPSKVCKNHILLVQKSESLTKLDINSLTVGTGNFAIVFGEKLGNNQIEEILIQNEKFKNIIEISLFVPKGGKVFSVFGRSLENDKEITLLNVWKNGRYIWSSSVYPKGRMHNLKGTAIKATSFQFPPFNYKENPEREDEEYAGVEVCIYDLIIKFFPYTIFPKGLKSSVK